MVYFTQHVYCTKCDLAFMYSASEQRYLMDKGLHHRVMCHACSHERNVKKTKNAKKRFQRKPRINIIN